MFKKCRKALAISIALTLILGIAAYAQLQQGTKVQKQRPVQQKAGVAGPQNQGPAMAGPQSFRGGGPNQANRQEHFFRMASLQRILMPPGPGELDRLGIMLSLTDAQKKQVKALYKQFYDTARPIAEQRGTLVQGVLNALQAPSPNKGQLQAAANQVFQADNTIVNAEFDFWIAFKGILNAQQQQALGQAIQQKALAEMGGGRGGQMGNAPVK